MAREHFFTRDDYTNALTTLDQGLERAKQLQAGASPWMQQKGRRIDGFHSDLDGSVQLYGTAGVAYNGFVSAGNYSYVGGPGLFHLAQGAASVYGYSAGQASDFAYHYAGNAGSAYVVSGTSFSYMSCTDTVNGSSTIDGTVSCGSLSVSAAVGAGTAVGSDYGIGTALVEAVLVE